MENIPRVENMCAKWGEVGDGEKIIGLAPGPSTKWHSNLGQLGCHLGHLWGSGRVEGDKLGGGDVAICIEWLYG